MKNYDATQEFRPFDRSKDAPKLHPNKEHARVVKARALRAAKEAQEAGK